jgi:hypothetical protein
MNIKKKKKEAVGRLLYSRINTVTPALRVGAAEGSSSLFLPFLSRSFPPVLLRQPKQPPPALISKDLKKEKKENVFSCLLTYLCIDCDMKTMFAGTSGANIHIVDVGGGSKNRKSPQKMF